MEATEEILWHGTSEPVDKIRAEGLTTGRLGLVFLTDNPQLAIDYAYSDQERTGLDNLTLVEVRVAELEHALLSGDPDHTLALDWRESLADCDQCTHAGPISPRLVSARDAAVGWADVEAAPAPPDERPFPAF
jgi:hypothetical protein